MWTVRQVGIIVLVASAALGSVAAGSQTVYRIVGPDGRVTFSDKPPPETQGRATPAPTVVMPGGAPAAAGGGALPFELRNVSSRFPVTLYSGQDCGPCQSGRSYLTGRGIPFTERTVTSEDDIEALKRLAGAARLPLLTIGGQQIKGFSEAEWTQFLDAAGYPKVSQLPSTYRNPPPAPMVAVQQAPQRPAAGRPQAPQQPQEPPPQAGAAEDPPPVNPAGIRF